MEIAVRRRTLWVGPAAVPLHNITRVEASMVRPALTRTWGQRLMWKTAAVSGAVVLALRAAGADELSLAPLAVTAVLLFVLLRSGQVRPVLAVETAGGSCVAVTLPNLEQLAEIARQIVHAIDHPEAEFTRFVYQYTYNGPVFNQHGRTNTGIRQ
ncbi:DUF6232 family protein [Streptomyces sp. NPDC021224]|uniref:DUF6232 family protein n=1 Tax=unclassified Streptomyces TaxID=2593676 RepID=UPI00379DCE13